MKKPRQYNFTTIRAGGRKGLSLEARAEVWLNDKSAEGWNLERIIPIDEKQIHIVMWRTSE